ncbi:MAG TPA: hypothetical protein PLZ31_11530 [Myxococcota bacterium]|nr:hypothetical protein [Myxococcota bacterium]
MKFWVGVTDRDWFDQLGFDAVRTEIAVLSGMTLFMIAASLKRHRTRLE